MPPKPVHPRKVLSAGLLCLTVAALSPTTQAADKPANAGSKATKTCDPNVVHTGPRGGKYYRTPDCRKVYLKKGR